MRSSYSSAMIATSRIVVFSSSESDRKSTRLNSSHLVISYAVFCLKKKKQSLAAPDLLRHQRVRADRARMHIVVHEMSQLQDVDLSDRNICIEPPAAAPFLEQGHA